MPLTDAEKSARKRAKKESQGMVRLGVDHVWPQQKSDIKLYLSGKATIVKNELNQLPIEPG